MNLSKFSVNRPVTITMLVLIIVLLGTVSLTRIPLDLLPKIEIPVAIISTSYSGAGPHEIENMITRTIESAIATVGNIDNISSVSSQGSSTVIAQFNFGTDMEFATLEMRERVDMVKGFLPDGASNPMVLKIDPNAMPIIMLSLTSNRDLASLQNLAEETIKTRLERIDGVASVDVGGGYEQIVEVVADPGKLLNFGLNIGQVAQMIGASNLNMPGGTIKSGHQELTLRTIGEFKDIESLEWLPITLPSGGIINLKDIAEVNLTYKEINHIARTNGRDSISINIQKQSGRNTVQVAELVNREIEALKKDYPDIVFETVLDQSQYIKKAISSVFLNAIFGAILAISILYLFLRSFRTTLIIGTSIPISIIATFILLYFNNITLNLMTLGGLALGVGMLVDSAIVVLENIYRFRTEGFSRAEAAVKGASEVGMAVTASTLTTVAVFIPIVFVQGITSIIFKELALTVTLALGASLFISLSLIPMLSSKILKIQKKDQGIIHKKNIFSKVYDLFDKGFYKTEGTYKRLLNWSLIHRKLVVIVSIVVFIISIASLFAVGAEFFPSIDEGQIEIRATLPLGSQLHEVDGILQEIEEKVRDIEEVKVMFSSVGGGFGMGIFSGSGARGTITIMLTDLSERRRSSEEVASEIRNILKDIPGAEISVNATSNMMMGMGGDPINIKLFGDDLETLGVIADDIQRIIESVEGTREVITSVSRAVPEVQVQIDKDRAALYGLTTAQIGTAVRNQVFGVTATRYKHNGNEIDVIVRGDGIVRESLFNLENLEVPTPMGINIPLTLVADISVEKGPIRINREGQQRVVTVSGKITDRDLRSVIRDIELELENYVLPQGYRYEIGGQNQELNNAFADLSMAFLLAVLLIYMVLAAQFESLVHPFTIILTVPLSIAGGALGLFITGRSLNVPSLIGAIILAGIVVNNAIVLVDYINTLRRNGMSRLDAIITAGPIRLRPILMTTLTTALGLIPLSLGIGEASEVMAGMATVVIGGLMLSTLLTLVLIPVVYTIIDDLTIKVIDKFGKTKDEVITT